MQNFEVYLSPTKESRRIFDHRNFSIDPTKLKVLLFFHVQQSGQKPLIQTLGFT